MRRPIHLQIFVPFAALLAVAVIGGAWLSSYVAARRAGALELQQLARLAGSLNAADFPYSAAVLERMRGLSGAEFIAVDEAGRVQAGTIDAAAALPTLQNVPVLSPSTTSLNEFPHLRVGSESYFVTALDTPGQNAAARRLFVLYPRETWERLQWDSAWPPLAIGALTWLLMLLVAGWLAHRIGRRVDAVRSLFVELQSGRFPQLPIADVRDELDLLVASANEFSGRLESLQREIARTERWRLLAQLAGGLAHQLRNSVAGARMAVQLHQRECPAAAGDDCLAVALAQLQLTEQQVRGLLSLSREPTSAPQPGELAAVLSEVEQLLTPQARHLQIDVRYQLRLTAPVPIVDRDLFRGAVMNLVLNAVEAAGPRGRVQVEARESAGEVHLTVTDSGDGPPESIRDCLAEPFVTSKPEGVGLGLMLAQQAAERQQGQLGWSHEAGRTVFTLQWPIRRASGAHTRTPAASPPSEAAPLPVCAAAGSTI